MDLVIATNNTHKTEEFKRILEPYGYDLHTMKQMGFTIEVEETGDTFKENAWIKANTIFQKTGMATVADDSGLEVDALNGQPGVYSARFGGQGLTDPQRCERLLEKLKKTPSLQRTARFICWICVILSPQDIRFYQGRCEGFISQNLMGEGGFGYDPIFMINEYQSFAMLTEEEKDRVSHRGAALQAMKQDFHHER